MSDYSFDVYIPDYAQITPDQRDQREQREKNEQLRKSEEHKLKIDRIEDIKNGNIIQLTEGMGTEGCGVEIKVERGFCCDVCKKSKNDSLCITSFYEYVDNSGSCRDVENVNNYICLNCIKKMFK